LNYFSYNILVDETGCLVTVAEGDRVGTWVTKTIESAAHSILNDYYRQPQTKGELQ